MTATTVGETEQRTRYWRGFDKTLPLRIGSHDRTGRDAVLTLLRELPQYSNLPRDHKPHPIKGAATILDWLLTPSRRRLAGALDRSRRRRRGRLALPTSPR